VVLPSESNWARSLERALFCVWSVPRQHSSRSNVPARSGSVAFSTKGGATMAAQATAQTYREYERSKVAAWGSMFSMP